MIGRTRVALGPLRDLAHLDALLAAVRTVRGVDDVAIEAFVERRVLLVVHVLHPVDLEIALPAALGAEVEACGVEAGRLSVLLATGAGPSRTETVDAVAVEVAAGGSGAVAAADRSAPRPGGVGTEALAVRQVTGTGAVDRVGHGAAPVGARAADDGWGDPEASPWAAGRDDPAPWVAAHPAPGVAIAPAAGSTAPASRGVRTPGPAFALPPGPSAASATGSGPEDLRELLELSFARSPVAKALIAPDGTWLRVNARLCAVLGREQPDLLRRRMHDLTHPDDPRLDADLVADGCDGCSVPRRFVRADGTVVPAQVEIAVVRADDGAPRWFVVEIVERPGVAVDRPRALGAHAA